MDSGIADQIIADLIVLGVDAKRKNPEIRHACDHSIEVTKPFSSSANVSKHHASNSPGFRESMRNHPEFIAPLLMACHSKNPKLVSHAIKTLGRVIQLQLLSSEESTPEGYPDSIEAVVDALNDASSIPDIQVKLLQLLPSFCQLYSFRINGDILSKLLYICSNLQGVNKSPIIVNTAQATFSQLLDIAFEKIDSPESKTLDSSFTVPIDNQQTIQVDQYSYDAQRLVADLCTLIEHHKPSFLKTNYISEDYGFEVLESLIKNNSAIFLNHVELAFLLRTRVAPILLRFLSSSKDFTLMVKVSRLIFLLLNDEFDILKIESEVTLTLLTHIISKESNAPYWKKILALEIYAAVFKNSELLRKMYREYDNNPTEERKSVLSDLLNVCLFIVNEQKHILNSGELIQLPPVSQDPPAHHSSNPKQQQRKLVHPAGLKSSDFANSVRFIDSIDKQDPPQIVDTYNLYLILQLLVALSDCIQLYTLDLMKSTDPVLNISSEFFEDGQNESLKLTYEGLSDIIKTTWKIQISLIDIYIHSTLDNELFSNTLKLLENLCYCSGILSLYEIKHAVFKYLAICAIKLDGVYGYKSRVMSISESIVGTISSTLGHAISSTNITATDNLNGIKFYPRTINSRQILCFHTLVRLAVSLGGCLREDWKIVYIVLQWFSYYIDGSTGFNKKDVPPISEYLGNRDLQIIEHSLSELNKSIFNLEVDTFTLILKTGIFLSKEVMDSNMNDLYGKTPMDKNGELQACGFNRLYYINKISDMCIINPLKFLIIPDNNLDVLKSFFETTVNNRAYSDEIRLLASRDFNQIIRTSAEVGFENSEQGIISRTEDKILLNMCGFMQALSDLPISKELLVANCEAEIYLQMLETLKTIVDRYGSLIRQAWDTVTEMLNFPFVIIQRCDSEIIQEKIINELVISVLKSSFETLKVILDELLHCIPKIQIKVIIDSLYNFVNQQFDLNISFNSVSYFWLISDYIKEKLESSDKKLTDTLTLKLEQNLEELVVHDSKDDYQYYQYLWIYLVLKLARTISDDRVQVRNGSIITIFNMIESFASDESLLYLLYNVVLYPVVLQMAVPVGVDLMSEQDKKDWMESFINIFNGMAKLLLNRINSGASCNMSDLLKIWGGISKFFVKLVNLDYNWTELNVQIFKNYYDILESFTSSKQQLPIELLESLYEPWSLVKINYNFNNISLYQSSLCSFVNCFSVSMKLFKPIMTPSKFEKMLMILNSSIRYPLLGDNRTDNSKATNLQKAVLDSISDIVFDTSDDSYVSYESLLLQQLNFIIVLPFHTRDLIVKKLGDKGVKIPTFIASSYSGMKILEKHLNEMNDLTFLNNGSINKVMRSLLEPTKLKGNIVTDEVDDCGNKKEVYLWMISFNLLTNLIIKVIDLLLQNSSDTDPNDLNIQHLNQFIKYCIQAFNCCFITNNVSTESDLVDYKLYNILKEKLLVVFDIYYDSDKEYQIKSEIVEEFIFSIWSSSFFYKHDSLMNSILPEEDYSTSSMDGIVKILTDDRNWDIYGTTEQISVMSRLQISKACFDDLVGLSDLKKYKHIGKLCLSYFIARCAYGLRKLNTDVQLLNARPIPHIQIFELELIANGLMNISSFCVSDDTEVAHIMLKNIYPLIIRLLPRVSNRELQTKLSNICINL